MSLIGGEMEPISLGATADRAQSGQYVAQSGYHAAIVSVAEITPDDLRLRSGKYVEQKKRVIAEGTTDEVIILARSRKILTHSKGNEYVLARYADMSDEQLGRVSLVLASPSEEDGRAALARIQQKLGGRIRKITVV